MFEKHFLSIEKVKKQRKFKDKRKFFLKLLFTSYQSHCKM